MEELNNLINELKIDENKYKFIPSIIREINMYVRQELILFIDTYKLSNNKYLLLSNLVNIGLEFDNKKQNTLDNIYITQMIFFHELISPVVIKIKNICLKLNLELVNEFKILISNLILNSTIYGFNKFDELNKNIKFLQINCFCKNINLSNLKDKDIEFEDFGITIKISNYHLKELFRDLISNINLFTQNDNKDKKFDWVWKAYNYSYLNLDNNLINEFNPTNPFDSEKLIYDNSFDSIDLTNQNNLLNDVNNIGFKIFQKTPNVIKTSIQHNTITEPIFLNTNKLDEHEINKNISSSIIIEDDSFLIPISVHNDNSTNYSNIH